MMDDLAEFVRTQTVLAQPPLVPEISLQLATEITPLWQLSEERLKGGDLPPPFWAFAWPGGQGIARYVLDHPEVVRGKCVLDFAAGGGIGAIAAAKAGATVALADDIDRLAQASILINAKHNNVAVELERVSDMEKPYTGADIIVVGDVCYQQAMSSLIMRWLHLCREQGVRVLIADPGRAYVPKDGLKELARYNVPTSRELEDQDNREVVVWELTEPA